MQPRLVPASIWRILPVLAALVLSAAGAWAAPQSGRERAPGQSDPDPNGVTWVSVQGQLDSGTLSLLKRAIDDAQSAGGQLVIELDSPGGEVTLMWRIARAVDEASSSGVETIAWVHDHASSAAALLALACERLYMRTQASIGSATPVQIGPAGLIEMGEHEREKMNSQLRADFRAMAESHNRSGILAEAMVDKEVEAKWVRIEGELQIVDALGFDEAQEKGQAVELRGTVSARGELLNLTGTEASQLGFSDGIADDAEELLEKVGLSGVPVNYVVRSRSEDTAAFLEGISGLLLVAALILGYMELKAPGFGVPGILSIVSLGLFLFGRYLVGLADIPHIVLIALGVILLAVEILVLPGFLWIGLGGGILVLGGLVWAWVGDGLDLSYAMDRRLLLDGGYNLVWLMLASVAASWALARFLPRTPILRNLVLAPGSPGGASGAASAVLASPATLGANRASTEPTVGAVGTTRTALRPVGKVVLEGMGGREFEARAEGLAIEAGSAVRVVEVQGARIVVGAAHESTSTADQ